MHCFPFPVFFASFLYCFQNFHQIKKKKKQSLKIVGKVNLILGSRKSSLMFFKFVGIVKNRELQWKEIGSLKKSSHMEKAEGSSENTI